MTTSDRSKQGDRRRDEAAGASEAFRRLSLAEQGIGELRTQFAGFNAKLDGQGQSLSAINSELAEITRSVHARASTDWKTLASWAAVVITVIVLYTTLNLAPLREQIAIDREQIRQIQADNRSSLEGEKMAAEKRGRYLEKIERLEREVAAVSEMQLRRPQQ